MEDRDPLTERVMTSCYRVYNVSGPGFNKKIYHNALTLDFDQEGLKYETEKRFEVYYQNNKVGKLIIDLVVENKVIVEVKAITGNIPDIFKYQVISYLRVSSLMHRFRYFLIFCAEGASAKVRENCHGRRFWEFW
ncbi:MAG: GxxExxY protein [Candidatus Scalindua sp.]|nr:GxxExxY protein [Candidatus Scalindua sp.]